MSLPKIEVNADWDAEAKVWVATSDDVPGLVSEAETLEDLQKKLTPLIRELLEAGGVLADNNSRDIPVNLVAHLSVKGVVRTDSPSTASFRERELEWRRTHAETLRQFENEWVVLEGVDIIAHGADAAQVIREATSRGINTPYIFFVEPESDDSVRIGL